MEKHELEKLVPKQKVQYDPVTRVATWENDRHYNNCWIERSTQHQFFDVSHVNRAADRYAMLRSWQW
jgi:hypothetical protein